MEINHLPEAEPSLNETLDKLWDILARRRWWVLLTAGAVTLATFVVLSQLPNRYSSEATLLVVQQQVPQRYVVPTSTTDIREALQATTQEVLSRTRLLGIINEFSLYENEKNRLSPEGLLELMRRDIDIQPLENHSDRREVTAFKISFLANTPQMAQEVTGKLTSLFIEQNLETRERQAATTTNFLHEQLEAAKQKLADAEEEVRRFKMQHLGELPEQQQGNLAILAGLQTELQNTMSALNRAREQGEYLQSLSQYRTLGVQGELARLQSERATLLERYTPLYPAVARLDEKIAQKEAVLKTLGPGEVPASDKTQAGPPSPSMAPAERDTDIAQLKGQLEANRLEIANLSKEETRLKEAITQYQNRLNATPVREQQIAGILRNYDLLKQDYADLLNKEMQSQLATDLEKRQEGQQFRLVDRPSLPTVPASPNRVKISLAGVAAGVALGLILAFFVDLRDTSFHSEEGLSRFALPFVIGVPLLLTAEEERSRAWRRALEWLAGSALTLAVFAAEVYEFYLYSHG